MIDDQKYSDLRLAIVCPMANEKDTVESFVKEVLSVCHPFKFKSIQFYAVVDLVSEDGTLISLQRMASEMPALKVVFSPENENVVDAYKKGYREAITNDADWILEIDAGFSHRPEDIPLFFETMLNGRYDCVFGSRFCAKGGFENGSFKRLLFSLGGTWVANILLGTKLSDMTSGFELLKRDALFQILAKGIHSKGPFFQTEIRSFAHRFKIVEVPIIYNAATEHFHRQALLDALINLMRLFKLRLKGQLFN